MKMFLRWVLLGWMFFPAYPFMLFLDWVLSDRKFKQSMDDLNVFYREVFFKDGLLVFNPCMLRKNEFLEEIIQRNMIQHIISVK